MHQASGDGKALYAVQKDLDFDNFQRAFCKI